MFRRVVPLLLMTPMLAMAGCVVCEPDRVEGEVVLRLVEEEVRSLPVLASGAWKVAGIDAPDSHGRLVFEVDATDGRLGTVAVRPLSVTVRVGGAVVPTVVTNFEGFGRWQKDDDGYAGTLREGRDLEVWWTVDRGRMSDIEQVVLRPGEDYEVSIDFDWDVNSCTTIAEGSTTLAIADDVRDSVISQSFRVQGNPKVTQVGATASFEVNLVIKNGIDTTIDGGRAVLLALSKGTDVPGVAVWTSVTTTVDVVPGRNVEPGQVLKVTGESKPHTLPSGALSVLILWVDHEPADDTPGVTHDLFGFVVEPGLT